MGKVLMALVLYVIYKGVKEIRITLKKITALLRPGRLFKRITSYG